MPAGGSETGGQQEGAAARSRRRLIAAVVPLAAGALLAALPAPAGLTPAAWRYFALFVAVVLAMIGEPLPAGAIGLLGVTVASLLGLVASNANDAVKWALGGFS